MEFEWPDNFAAEVWGELLDGPVQQNDVQAVLDQIKPHMATYVAEMQTELKRLARANDLLRQTNKNLITTMVEECMLLQNALAEVAPEHDLLFRTRVMGREAA